MSKTILGKEKCQVSFNDQSIGQGLIVPLVKNIWDGIGQDFYDFAPLEKGLKTQQMLKVDFYVAIK